MNLVSRSAQFLAAGLILSFVVWGLAYSERTDKTMKTGVGQTTGGMNKAEEEARSSSKSGNGETNPTVHSGRAKEFQVSAENPGNNSRESLGDDLTVLTYNTHLFEDSTAELGAAWKEQRIVFDDDKRANEIVERIKTSGADIVGLQEVWAYTRQDWFVAKLEHVYPYHYHVPGSDTKEMVRIVRTVRSHYPGVEPLIKQWNKKKNVAENLADIIKKNLTKKGRQVLESSLLAAVITARQSIPQIQEYLKVSSGLMVFSKYKLMDVKFTPFPQRKFAFDDEESLNSKGVITATVEPGLGGPTFRIGITHASTDVGDIGGGNDQPDLRDLAQWTAGPSHVGPAIMMGDFNVPRGSTKFADEATQIAKTQSIFKAVDAVDAFRAVHQEPNHATVDPQKNLLGLKFWSPNSYKPPKCLDYVFVKKPKAGLRLEPVEAEVLLDWKYEYYPASWTRVWADKWDSNAVAIRSFQLKGDPYLFAIHNDGKAHIQRINEAGNGYSQVFTGRFNPKQVGTAFDMFQLDGHPYFFALNTTNTAAIARIHDDGEGWKSTWSAKWDSNAVAIRSFQLKGHPYLFALHKDGNAYIRRINEAGNGYTQVFMGKFNPQQLGTTIDTFQLDDHPYVFARDDNNRAAIYRIRDGGAGWTPVWHGEWDSSAVVIRSFPLKGRPHLFVLHGHGKASIRRINDAAMGYSQVFMDDWDYSSFVGTAVATFAQEGHPYVFTLLNKESGEASITQLLGEPTTVPMDLSDHYPVRVKFKVVRE